MKQLRLALEWFKNPDHIPLICGLELGWFRDAGIELSLIEPEEHLDAAKLFESGELEAAITEPIHLVVDRAVGRKLLGFARFLHTDGGVLYLKGKGISRPRDMAGCRVQYPGAPGPGGRAIVATMIAADGGVYAPGDLHAVNNGFAHTEALSEGKAELATLAFYNFEVVEARHRGLDADFFSLKEWGVPDFNQLILVAPEEKLKEEEGMYKALSSLLSKGIDLVKQEPIRALEIYRTHTGSDWEVGENSLDEKIYQATVPCFTYDLSMSADYYSSLVEWMKRTEQIENSPGCVLDDAFAKACWSNRFVFPSG